MGVVSEFGLPKPGAPAKPKAFEDFQADLQKQSMANVRMMLITMLANDPPVSKWPVEVRRYHYMQLIRAAELFAPQVDGEYEGKE